MTQQPHRPFERSTAAPKPATLGAAQAFIARSYGTAVGLDQVPPAEAEGRILGADIVAQVALPRFDAAAMDGYAVRRADLAEGADTRLSVAGRSAAGHPAAAPLKRGEAARIFTGAMVPRGADLVLMQEDCRRNGDALIVPADRAARRNIRRKGEDVTVGDTVLRRGERLTGARLALASALHLAVLPVYRRLKVALFSTGDELRAAGEAIGTGQIGDANRPMLRGLLAGMGCEVLDRGILRDDPERQIAALMDAAAQSDLIVTSGGASVGEEDHLTNVIRRRGHLEVWRLKIKPGKPVGIGDIDDCPILALPGNPVAAAMNGLMLGTPLVAALSGALDLYPRSLRLPLAAAVAKRPGRWEAVLGHYVDAPGRPTAVAPEAKTGSAMLSALAAADGFIILPEPLAHAEAGDLVDFAPLR
jgi:molybdopterin molybdotransferase